MDILIPQQQLYDKTSGLNEHAIRETPKTSVFIQQVDIGSSG